MKTATAKMIARDLSPYIKWDEISPYIEMKNVPKITSKLLASYSNIYCSISGNETECPVFIVKSKKHVIFLRIIIDCT